MIIEVSVNAYPSLVDVQGVQPIPSKLAITHRSEWKRLAVPCGSAGSAANTHYDQDVLASAIVWKIIPRFPFNVEIGF